MVILCIPSMAIFTSWLTSSMGLRSDDHSSLGRSITDVNFDREINLLIKFKKLISSRLFPHTNSFAHWLFIDQYLECVSMWDSRLRVVKGEHHIEFYYKNVRKCFIDNFKLKKKKKSKRKKKGHNSNWVRSNESQKFYHSKLWSRG